MKFLFFFLYLLLFNTLQSLSQHLKGFSFISNNHLIYSIDIKTGNFNQLDLNNEYKTLGKVKNWDFYKEELPKDFNINIFQVNNQTLFTIPGTGHVYEFKQPTLELNRIDQTYFRGYNFHSSQFLRKDTIYSIGGEGFWQKHSIITFYNSKAAEWDIVNTVNKNPFPVQDIISGYSKDYDTFFSAYLVNDSVFANKNIYLMMYSFKNKQWLNKGKISKKLTEVAKKNYKSIWTGKHLILFNYDHSYLYVLHPFDNKYSVFSLNDRFLSLNREIYFFNNYLYSRALNQSRKNGAVVLDSIGMSTLLKSVKKYENIYEEDQPFYLINKYYLISLICLLLIGLLIIYRFKLIGNKKIRIPESEWLIIHEFLKNPDKKISSTQINTLLQINNKSYDNQRQIRNRVISNINQELFSTLNSQYLILRMANQEDKRMMDYYINPDVSEKDLKKLGQSIKV